MHRRHGGERRGEERGWKKERRGNCEDSGVEDFSLQSEAPFSTRRVKSDLAVYRGNGDGLKITEEAEDEAKKGEK